VADRRTLTTYLSEVERFPLMRPEELTGQNRSRLSLTKKLVVGDARIRAKLGLKRVVPIDDLAQASPTKLSTHEWTISRPRKVSAKRAM